MESWNIHLLIAWSNVATVVLMDIRPCIASLFVPRRSLPLRKDGEISEFSTCKDIKDWNGFVVVGICT